MKRKRRQRVLSILMALLMIVGLIPTDFTVSTAKAATSTIDLSGGLSAGTVYGDSSVCKVEVLETMAFKPSSPAVTLEGTTYGGFIQGTVNPAPKAGDIPTSGAAFKISAVIDCSITFVTKAAAKVYHFVDSGKVKDITGTSVPDGSMKFELKAGTTYYFYLDGSKVCVYGITIESGSNTVDWSKVDAPVLNTPVQSGSKIDVPYTAVIGDNGAEQITVEMYNGTTLVDTQVSKAAGTSGTISFSPSASGTYTFKAKLSRTGQTDILSVSDVSGSFSLPLATPSITSTTSLGNGSVSLEWSAVSEATSYLVSYSADGTTYSTPQEVTGTSTTITGLSIGNTYTFKVVAKRGTDLSADATKEGTVSGSLQRVWQYSDFGQGVSASKDYCTGNVYNGDLVLGSYSGKIVPANTDGLAYYYTKIDPSENFVLSATVKVNKWTLSNGQEGFGLMAADAVGAPGDSTTFWNNSYIAGLSKIEYFYNTDTNMISNVGSKFTMKLGAYAQEKKGAVAGSGSTVPSTFLSTAKTLDLSCVKYGQGTYNIVGNYTGAEPTGTVSNLTEFKLTLIRDNTGYRCIYTDPDGNVMKQTFYDYAGTNLTQIDPNNIYVGFFASRNAEISVKDVSFTTSNRATDPAAEQPEITYVDPIQTVTSASATGIQNYNFTFTANSNGVVTVKDPAGNVILDNVAVTAGSYVTAPAVTLNKGANAFEITFDPNDDFAPGDYQKLSSYDAITFTQTVNYKTYGTPGQSIWVSPDGKSSSSGNINDPMDLATAVKYVQPGQTIVLKEGTYNFANSISVARGIDGTAENPINLVADPSAATRPVLDFGKVGGGISFAGNYWYMKGFDVTNTVDGVRGLLLAGSNCTLDQVNTYHNGNTGIQISRLLATDQFDLWPANNLVLNCTSYGNADKGYEDADGFAAKLTVGNGNIFRGCISHNNADDGWDLFAKPESGPIGKVVLENCIAYSNGVLEDGTNAGNGNGFKLGGSSITGLHELKNCISYNNKAKGIDSNSCPDIIVTNSTSFNNGGSNVAFYTNDSANTNFVANGIISFRTSNLSVAETLKLKGTQAADSPLVYNSTNYYWNGIDSSVNTLSAKVSADWFTSLDTTIIPTRDADGSINMHGLLMLTDKAPADAGARFVATPSKTIAIPDSVPAFPKVNTGDMTHIYLFITLSIMSGAALVGLYFYDKKKKTIVKR